MRAVDRLRSWVPRWWRGEEEGVVASALTGVAMPAEFVFRSAVRLRNGAFNRGILRSAVAGVPVISIGNITVGGTGKTPFTAWTAGRLLKKGEVPGIVLRGYGQDEIEVHRDLNPGVLVAASRRRMDGIEWVQEKGATCIIMDDAFQHRSVARDIDIVLIAAESWARSRHMLPRGPYRESMSALSRASLVMVMRKIASFGRAKEIEHELKNAGLSVATGIVHLVPSTLEPIGGVSSDNPPIRLAGRRVVALTSLADPGPFEAHLVEMGATVQRLAFPDHHDFDDADMREIARRAGGDPVVMTLKEAVKLRQRWPADITGFVLKQEVVVEEGLEVLDEFLSKAMNGSR